MHKTRESIDEQQRQTMTDEATEHRQRLEILEKHLGDKFYETGELHISISDAMEEYSNQPKG